MAAEFFLSVSLSYLKGSLTSRKIFRQGADGFTSPPKEIVLLIFIAFKIHRSGPALNPRTLSRVRRTMTITPPRTTIYVIGLVERRQLYNHGNLYSSYLEVGYPIIVIIIIILM
jgi:hypothetical protein